ncbi:hypothetical protein BDD12DRAFT_248458 [Trichophaea hybrida]|nr:hypothetical protein BDD12DRAFT_248458 [Trichophaea hybrida]
MSSPTNTEWHGTYRHQRHRGKPSVPSRSQGPPQQNRNGPSGMHSARNDRIGASDRNFDPPSQPKGFSRSALAPKHNPSQPYQTSGTTKPINGYDVGVIRAVPSLLRREAQKAILDMRQCNVQFNDVIQETGVDPNHLKKLFAAIDIPIPSSNTPPPTLSKGPGHSVPPKEIAKPNSREPPLDKSDIDKAQMIKQLEREQRDKERREAEAKAAEMVRKREAAKEEEERQRRFVEVQAAREAFQKKIESLNLKKAASPGIPPTPISSTPVNAAVVKAHPQPILPTSSVLQGLGIPIL